MLAVTRQFSQNKNNYLAQEKKDKEKRKEARSIYRVPVNGI